MDFKLLVGKLKTYPFAISCFVLVIVCLATIYMRRGVSEDFSLKEADLASQQRAIEENRLNAEGLEKHFEALQALNEEIKSQLLDSDERATNLNRFYDLEKDFGLSYESISQSMGPDPMHSKGGARELKLHSTIVFNITLKASFQEVLRFMHGLDQTDLLLRVIDYGITDSGSLEDTNQVNASMRIVVMAKPDNG